MERKQVVGYGVGGHRALIDDMEGPLSAVRCGPGWLGCAVASLIDCGAILTKAG